MPAYLMPADVERKIEELKTGEIPDMGEIVKDYDSPYDFHRMFPELLCEHGINRTICCQCSFLIKGGKMSLEKPNCYECEHLYICAFTESIDRAIKRHLGWVDVNMREPEWQKIHVAVAKACKNYKLRDTE